MQPLKTCTIAISVILWLACCHAVFADGIPTLSHRDIIGTFRLERIEQNWRGDAEWIEESLKWFDNKQLFEIREDRYILGPYEYETSFTVSGTIVEDGAIYMGRSSREYYRSDFGGHFPEYPRIFKSVIVTGGYFRAVEVLDFNTLVIFLHDAWLLYKLVE